MNSSDFESLCMQVGKYFTPSAPIDSRDLFAGRTEQLTSVVDAIVTKGQHAIICGERGVGKTSLVSILKEVLQQVNIVTRVNCTNSSTFGGLWKQALEEVRYTVRVKSTAGFVKSEETAASNFSELLSGDPKPNDIYPMLRDTKLLGVFVFDEFDQAPKSVRKQFADTIKALSDYACVATVVLVGVGDDVRKLIEYHQSTERALVQVPMPRMHQAEIATILDKASSKLGMTFNVAAQKQIVRLSQGLPTYAHLIGLHSARNALDRESLDVTSADVAAGIKKAASKVSESLLQSYADAVDSARKDALFRQILLACALAKCDTRGTFAASDVRVPLGHMGLKLNIPAYAAHLNKFASRDRGPVLEKTGATRRYRYHFCNPLLQPYVVMRGVSDKLITQSSLNKCFSAD